MSCLSQSSVEHLQYVPDKFSCLTVFLVAKSFAKGFFSAALKFAPALYLWNWIGLLSNFIIFSFFYYYYYSQPAPVEGESGEKPASPSILYLLTLQKSWLKTRIYWCLYLSKKHFFLYFYLVNIAQYFQNLKSRFQKMVAADCRSVLFFFFLKTR